MKRLSLYWPVYTMIVLLSLTACATTPDVSTAFVPGVHLQQYKTYAFRAGQVYDVDSEKTSDTTGVGPALEADIRQELERRGLKYSDNNPDLTFSYNAAKRLEHAGGEHAWPYHEGALDVVATDTAGHTVWSSHLQAVLDPKDKTHRQLKDGIVRAFKNYPSVK